MLWMNFSTAKTTSKGSSFASSTIDRGTITGNKNRGLDACLAAGDWTPDEAWAILLDILEKKPNIQKSLSARKNFPRVIVTKQYRQHNGI
ncbi:hypothetical protein EN788_63365 [Mesorhizobium sp. M2D.F.Ca.ET.145.01.1.1]|nr:hypothetical protein EN788_63365 [Mesorhizobium sp. M2D.F.Ca.ET.145.01.1.1]